MLQDILGVYQIVWMKFEEYLCYSHIGMFTSYCQHQPHGLGIAFVVVKRGEGWFVSSALAKASVRAIKG